MPTTFDSIAPARGNTAAYEPLFEIGRGGMGVVYVAKAIGAAGFERIVVIKRLHKHLLQNDEAVNRFLDEARQAATLHHANIVAVQQVCKDEKGYFLVLDYVEGASVEQLLDFAYMKKTRLPVPVVFRLIMDVLEGLEAVHNATDAAGQPLGMLHRDVSIQNILVGRDGVARLTDFGIAKSKAASVSTDKSYLVGKLLYMPREAFQHVEPSTALDVYAVGVAMWLMITGTDPWPNATEAQLVEHVMHDRIPPISSVGLEVAPQIEAILRQACEPDISKRFQSARQMADAIERVSRGTGWMAVRGEVTELVVQLVGAELERRRERIAEVVRDPSARGLDSLLPSMPPEVPALPMNGSWRENRTVVIGGGIAVLLVLIAAAILMWPGPARVASSPAATSQSAVVSASSTGIVAAKPNESAVPPVSSSSATPPKDAGPAATHREPKKSGASTPHSKPRATKPPSPRPKPRKTGTGIVRHNPYR